MSRGQENSSRGDQVAVEHLVNCFAGTPKCCLFVACLSGDVETVALLLQHGADPNTQGHGHGNSPLHAAAVLGTDDGCEMIRLLLARGANVKGNLPFANLAGKIPEKS